ncbi:MAG: MoaD/ThiS family protein [Acidobacteria bacterium]|nr:MoaD/ThiS family protein [Acidobacteriota bacterium]
MATLRLFAAAREAAGTGTATIDGATVAEVLAGAVQRFGPSFEAVLGSCRVWLNGDHAEPGHTVRDGDEVAVLPPVSGGT